MKRIICFTLLLLGLLMPNVYAEEKPSFSIKSIKASPGQEVTMSVTLNNNPPYQLLSIEIPLDVNQVEFKSCEFNGFSNALMSNCALNPNNEIVFYALTLNTNQKKLLNASGNILDIQLKILDKVTTDIPLTMKITSFGKSESEPIDFNVENGYIRISGDIELKVVNEKENLSGEVKKQEVTWNTSDGEVATVDEKGNVEFNGSGNATISAIDKNGNILYQKTYLVNKTTKNRQNKAIWIVFVSIILGLLGAMVYTITRKEKGK